MVCARWADLTCTAWRTNFNEELSVCLAEIFPLSWDIIFVIDGFNRTHWLASATVNALIRLDIKHASAFIDAIHRAFFDAGFIFYIDARFSDHIRHEQPPKNLASWLPGNSNSYSGRCAIFADSVYRSVMPTELEATFSSLVGKRVSIRLHDPEGGFRDILGHLETPFTLRNRHDDLIEFSHEQIFVWREVIERT